MSSCEEGGLTMGLGSVGILQVALFLRCVSNLTNFLLHWGHFFLAVLFLLFKVF